MRRNGVTGMDNHNGLVTVAGAAIGTVVTYLFGGWDTLLQALLMAAVLDYVAGVASAIKRGDINSRVGWWGLASKVGMFALVALCHIIDQTGIIGDPILRTFATWGYIINESVSFVENLGELGVYIPPKVANTIAVLRNSDDGR